MNTKCPFCTLPARLGIFDTAIALGMNKPTSIWETFVWGGFGGIIGTILAHPFHLIKTQMQSTYASPKQRSMTRNLFLLYSENGIRGMYRGAYASVPKAAMSSGAQLASFTPTLEFIRMHEEHIIDTAVEAGFDAKQYRLLHPERWQERRLVASIVCGGLAGLVIAVTMTPADTILTRLAIQQIDKSGRGLLYRGVMDCLMRTLREEGILGLYRGFWPNQMRIALHTTLLLAFYDQLKETRDR